MFQFAPQQNLRLFEYLADDLKKAEDGVFMAVVKLLADFVEGEYTVGVVEGNGPLTVLLFPAPPEKRPGPE